MREKIERAILNILSKTERLTPAQISAKLSYSRLEVMQTINHMVSKEQILFTYELGTAFVRLSYNKPVQISERIVLVPSNRNIPKDMLSKVAIRLSKGVAFGDGHHPTTSLIIQLLDETLNRNSNIPIKHALDIGTGTGILAIVAAKLGAEKVVATDMDSVALFEAKNNIKLNLLTDCIHLIQSDKIPDEQAFQLIIANLRLPTLVGMAEKFCYQIDTSGFVICSGFTNDESNRLITKFKQQKLECIQLMKHNKWASGVFTK